MNRNPFIITENYCGPEYFCDREFETSVLRSNIFNGRNTVLISPRRMGKSGLISHAILDETISMQYNVFSVDLFPTTSFAEMILILSNEIIGRMKSREKRFMDSFVSVVKSLRTGVKMNPVTGELEFSLSLGEIVNPKDSLAEIFQYLQDSPVPCILAIDEFQQIADYPETNVVALLRSYVQKCSNCRFIFAGSSRRMMEKLFNSPSEPFYMSSSPLYLDAIDREKYWTFAEKHFKNGGRILARDCFDAVYDTFEGHTWYVQRLLNELYERSGENGEAGPDDFQPALDYILRLYGKLYEEQFQAFPNAQKMLLLAIAREGQASSITSISFVNRHALKSPSTVQSAARPLYEKEVITKVNGAYIINNRFYSIWLKKRYGV